jgi:hypothetical protein
LDQILEKLSENSLIKQKLNDDAETRKFALKGFLDLVKSVGIANISLDRLNKIFDICIKAMGDYTMDKRGDIGSIVREASMVKSFIY